MFVKRINRALCAVLMCQLMACSTGQSVASSVSLPSQEKKEAELTTGEQQVKKLVLDIQEMEKESFQDGTISISYSSVPKADSTKVLVRIRAKEEVSFRGIFHNGLSAHKPDEEEWFYERLDMAEALRLVTEEKSLVEYQIRQEFSLKGGYGYVSHAGFSITKQLNPLTLASGEELILSFELPTEISGQFMSMFRASHFSFELS